ncbi:hypothetical protein PybrP1_010102 [[Pythium] brassicae (nom. inval.)]|nr:hypothetical protein PybrP1_010102 [[Pythium] brassicae (nom. inval.)]
MRGFAVPAAVAPAWNRMKELRALYAVQLPSRSAVQQRFSTPLAWRKSRASAASDSTKRRLSARRRSSVGALPSIGSGRRLTLPPASTRAALEASASLAEFEVLGVLGRGTFGVVKLARHVATGAAVALKVLDKRAVRELRQEKNVLREQTVHLLLDHAFVSTLFATFQDRHALYFVVEYCPGGEVFSLVYDHPGSLDDDDDDDDDDDNDEDDDDEQQQQQQRRSHRSSSRHDVGNQATHDDDEHTTSTTDSEGEDDAAQEERLRAARAAKLALYLANDRAKHALRSATGGGLREPHAAFYLAAPVAFPAAFEAASPDACALIRSLLAKNPSERPASLALVRASAFFKTHFATPHAWARLLARQHPAPFVPRLDGAFDTSLFVKAASYEDEGDDLYGY